jgi:hypothetical protein
MTTSTADISKARAVERKGQSVEERMVRAAELQADALEAIRVLLLGIATMLPRLNSK